MPQGKILPVKPALTDTSASFDEELPAGKTQVATPDNISMDNAATPPDSSSVEEPTE
ncbi:hypothetical protein [Pontibacter russatus]|uniref:hypothetical protein n=1 Tax=Pontibacter russatus TaxID=2694929 RepID=UPI00137B50AA|nr:hypothetical protein [Pontibacter russatus]